MEELNQLQKEWAVVNASRELLSIAKKRAIKYRDAIEFAKDNAEEVFRDSQTRLGKKDALDKLYEKFRQEAVAVSAETREDIFAEDLIERRIAELNRRLSNFPLGQESPDELKKERTNLEILLGRSTKTSLSLERITEHQAIYYDF